MKILKRFRIWRLIVFSAAISTGCTPKYSQLATLAPDKPPTPDYSDPVLWAADPGKPDPSDSVPIPLKAEYDRDSTVDVFFIHPTTYTSKNPGSWNAAFSDSLLNQKTDRGTIHFQASVFNNYNVYAPRYRQAHIFSYYTQDTVKAIQAFDMAYADVKAAFLYYLLHENRGKPVIIASHSQGTTHAKRLLKEFFDGKDLQEKLVAAYIIGLAVEPGYFEQLQPCRDSLQTGCFVSWRSFRKGFEPDFQPAFRQSVVTNPLSWTTDTAYAPVDLHKGAILQNFDKIIPRVNDARIYKDLLWISRPKFKHSRFYRSKNYHIGDINLFYMNIRENLEKRTKQYKAHL